MVRRIRSVFIPGVLGLSGLVGLASAVQADSLSEMFTTTTPIPATTTNWSNKTLLFQQFDPSLGTLESVSLTLTANLHTQLSVTNNSMDPNATGSMSEKFNLLVQDAGNYMGIDSVHGDDNFNPQLTYSTSPQNYGPLAVGATYTPAAKNKNGQTSTTVYNPTALQANEVTPIDWSDLQAEFTGSGTVGLTALAYAPSSITSSDSNQDVTQVTTASLTGSVTYTYDSAPVVPEPATMSVVLLGGAIGIGSLLRRRRTV